MTIPEPHNGDEFERAMDAQLIRSFLDFPLSNGVESRMRMAAHSLIYRAVHHVHPHAEIPKADGKWTWIPTVADK